MSLPPVLRPLSGALAGLLLLLSLLQLHGFSLPAWHTVIDRSPAPEVLAGQARWIRADDWAVLLPLVLAQGAQKPRFPETNDLIGYGGVNARVGYSVPVRNWVTLFRPQVWGYFLGQDIGLAWHWWSRVLGLFYASFLAFAILSRGRAALSALAAAALVFSPFLQFWSFNCEPLAAMMLLCFTAAVGIALAPSARGVVLWGILLAWAGGCFALGVVYPPLQVSLAWLGLFLVAGCLWRERGLLRCAGRPALRVAVLLAALGIAATACAVYLAQNADTIRAVLGTIYPGQRFSTGGELAVSRLFGNFLTLFLGSSWLRPFPNLCESGAFLYLFPLTAAAAIWAHGSGRRRLDPLLVVLGAFWLLAVVYAVIGVPAALARALLLDRVPGFRMILALGIADLAMLVVFLSAPPMETARRPGRASSLCLALLGCTGICAAGLELASGVDGASWLEVVAVSLAFFALTFPVARCAPASLGILALVSACATLWFNPLVRGGTDYLRANPLSRKVLELEHEARHPTRWLVYEDPALANLFRAIGVRAVNGVHYYPQTELWRRLGLERKGEAVYNRYAYVTFQVTDTKGEARLQLGTTDGVVMRIHPDHPAFRRLDLDYVVYVAPDRGRLDDAAALVWVASVGDKHIYRVLRSAAEGASEAPATSPPGASGSP